MRNVRTQRLRPRPTPIHRYPEWRERRYSEGMEQLGPTPRKEHKGRFSEGMDVASLPLTRDTGA